MKPIFIFGSGEKDPDYFYAPFLEQDAFVVAIDGGADLIMGLDVVPDLAIGDFDSITNKALEWLSTKSTVKIQYPTEKDFSDFELVCQKIVAEFDPTQVSLFCMQGKRADHFLFNLIMAEYLLQNCFYPTFYSENETIYFFDKDYPIKGNGKIGDKVSLIPLKNSVLIHQTFGLKYSLLDERLYRNKTKGLSNEINADEFEVSITDGQAMMIYNRRI